MKKIILFIMLLVGVTLTAQTVTLPSMASAAQNPNATAQVVTTDYTLTNTTVRNFIFTAPQPKPCTQDFVVKLDSVSGNHTQITVAVYGQKSAIKGDWTQIGTTSTSTLGSDIVLISNATANRYSNYKYVITGTGTGTTKIDALALKLYTE